MEYLREDGKLFALVLEKFDVQLSDTLEPRTANGVHYLQHLLEAYLVKRLVIRCTSTCNQTVTVQAVGHDHDAPRDSVGLTNIGGTLSLTATAPVTIGFDLDGGVWQSWVGVTITAGAAPPTAGQVQVSAQGERWVKVPIDERFLPMPGV